MSVKSNRKKPKTPANRVAAKSPAAKLPVVKTAIAKSPAKKSSAAKVSAVKAAANHRGKNHRAPAASAYYVSFSPLRVSIAHDKPKSGSRSGPTATFEEVRGAAIDALVAGIEDAERQLTACKRAASVEALLAL